MEVIEVAGKLLGLAVADLGGGGGGAESASEDEDTCWSREGSGASYEGGASDDDDGAGGKRKRMSTADRKARNRERNRLHARKTRQRKKQHVQELQLKIWGLRQERQRLLQLSTEHRTAGVLLALSCSPKQCVQSSRSSFTSTTSSSSYSSSSSSPRELGAAAPHSPPSLKLPAPSGRDWGRELASHEDALRKITQEFESMDGSQQIGEDACGTAACDEVDGGGGGGAGGGGGGVGGRGGAGKGSRGGKGTLADRTALRRERNRMHAKRTRNRKKLFVEACSVMIDKMKVENAQLEHEIQESGIRLPQESWVDEGQEAIPEEPLPEYLAALWDFAEGKTHCPKPASPGTPQSVADAMVSPPATPTPAPAGMRYSRQTSASSCTSTLSSTSTEASSLLQSSPAATRPPPSNSNPGQALEDASTLCAFMEAAQTRSAKRPRVRVTQQQQQYAGGGGGGGGVSGAAQQQQMQHQQHLQRQQQDPRVWSDHGSTTSESRGSSESDEDAANERRSRSSAGKQPPPTAGGEPAGGGGASGGDGGAMLSPAFWTSRQVLERYAPPRQQLQRG